MPIITPAYPAMCTTYFVTASNQMIITSEFKRGMVFLKKSLQTISPWLGALIVDKIIIGTAEWSELFSKHDFFTDTAIISKLLLQLEFRIFKLNGKFTVNIGLFVSSLPTKALK